MTDIQSKFATDVCTKYGPFLTKAIKDEETSDLESLFASPVTVVLQDSQGEEVVFTIGTDDNASMTWSEFQQASSKDLVTQDYQKTESDCLGVLGDRLLMEVARINTAGEPYLVAYVLVTVNDEGKIVEFESFSNLESTSLTG